MKNQPTTFKSRALPRFLRATCIAGLLPALVLLLSIQSSHAGSAKWKASPATGDWNTAGNWTAGGPPNGSADTATFASSNITGVSLSAAAEVNGIVFNLGGSAFTITASPPFILTVSGVGITNNSGITQVFVNNADASGRGQINFFNNATAGSSANTYIGNGSASASITGGRTVFFNTSTAGNAVFVENGTTVSGGLGGRTYFPDSSTGGNGTFTNNAGNVVGFSGGGGGGTSFTVTSSAGNGAFTNNGSAVSGADGSFVQFLDTSTAGSATFTNNGGTASGTMGGVTFFFDTTTAGNANLIANGGQNGGQGGSIQFWSDSTGGTARVEVFGNGTGDTTNGDLDISFHNAPGVTIGSIEGSGTVFLGAFNLTVGANNLSSTFSGVIEDGGLNGGTVGSLTKIGAGTLTLSTANTYTGGTTVSDGTLLIKKSSGFGTGPGAVQVNGGTLGGTGKIAGTVTVGTGSRTGAFLSPGLSATIPGIFTIQKKLTFKADATYQYGLNTSTTKADSITAKGVSISGALTSGTVFTVISNTAATPIAGTFSNLADGSTLIVGSNTYKANYEGGTGNDLTLTVQ